MKVSGVVYVLRRSEGDYDVVFRAQEGGFRPRRRFGSQISLFAFLTSELSLSFREAHEIVHLGRQSLIPVRLAESALETLWPDWRLRPRPRAASLPGGFVRAAA